MNRSLIPLLILTLGFGLHAGEAFAADEPVAADESVVGGIVKWVDEHGNVHYGEKVPDEYKDSAEEVTTEINVVAPEADVKMQNRKHASQLKREDEWRETQEAQARNQAQRQEQEPATDKVYTREECRDMYPNRTADRVACFKRAEEAGLK